MAKTTLVLGKLPGLNQQIEAAKKGFKKSSEMKKEWTNYVIRELIRQKCVPGKPYDKMVVNYEFHEGMNPRDPDNQLAGIKFIHDAFVSTGMIEDDNAFHISFGRIETILEEKFSVVVTWTVKE